MMVPSTISGVNYLPEAEKRAIYSRIIPPELLIRFQLSPTLVDREGNDLLKLDCPPGSTSLETELRHIHDFPDPLLYGHLTDTLNGLVHVLLYVVNDPDSPRFAVDRLPDGTSTKFGILHRNIEAELGAMQAGLAPGQIRRGLRILGPAIQSFESFIASLGHDLYFAEPLYYHNAIVFEQYGFDYVKGKKLMKRIQAGFLPGGEIVSRLDGSSPFRQIGAAQSIRLRSWAIHDGILGEPFTDVTMYKRIGVSAGISTSNGCAW